jgi:hypothetical protein
MKTIITHEFDSTDEAADYMARLSRAYAAPTVNIVIPEPQAPVQEAAQGAAVTVPPAGSGAAQQPPSGEQKPARKRRADAGQPRGPYKDTSNAKGEGAGAQTEGASTQSSPSAGSAPAPAAAPSPAASNDAFAAEIEARNAAARASVQNAAVPDRAVGSTAAPIPVLATGVPAAAAPKKLTHDDIRAHLALINKVPGLGMAGCHAFLAGFKPTGAGAPGVKRISDVKEEDFARFVAEIDARIKKFETEGK